MPADAAVQVVLAEGHAAVRQGLRALLDAADDLLVVAEVGSCLAALAAVRATRPGVLVLDRRLPGGGLDALLPVAAEAVPELRVVVLSLQDDPAIGRAVLAAGASGFVLKDAADAQLVTAVRAAALGGSWRALADARR